MREGEAVVGVDRPFEAKGGLVHSVLALVYERGHVVRFGTEIVRIQGDLGVSQGLFLPVPGRADAGHENVRFGVRRVGQERRQVRFGLREMLPAKRLSGGFEGLG